MCFLYHYTSIETLALIMSSRKIRFNCLSFVDDPKESIALDIPQVGRYCVVSCWTDLEEESLPMWNMYTPNMKGIRLKMRKFPFKEYPATMKGAWRTLGEDRGNNEVIDKYLNDYKSYVDEQKIAKEKRAFVIPPAPELIEINYTNDETLIKPMILFDDNSRFEISAIGCYKQKCWEFQSEWRYRIIFTPFNVNDNLENNFAKVKYSRRIPYKEFYVELSENAFEGAEVRLGPKTSEADLLLVKALVEKYQGSYTIPVKKSNLLIR